MILDSAVTWFLQWGNTPLGVAVLTALVLGVLRSVPRILRGILQGIRDAPERMLVGILNAIDRRMSSKGGGFL